jgi:hypothetical protein
MPEADPFLAEIAADQEPPDPDRLMRLRVHLNTLRGKRARLAEMDEVRSRLTKDIYKLETRLLVDAMTECRIRNVELDAEGNWPAVIAQLQDFVSAKIPEGGEQTAFAYLAGEGYEEEIRNTIEIKLATPADRDAVLGFLETNDLDYIETRKVHAQTLLRIVRELHRSGRLIDTETAKPMTLLGAYVGQVVKLKEKGETP